MSVSRHGKNLLWLLVAEPVQKLLALLLFVFVARRYTVEENGWYGTFVTVFAILVVLLNFGFYDVVVRDIARKRQGAAALLGASQWGQLLLSVPVGLAGGALLLLADYPPLLSVLLIIALPAALLFASIRMHYAAFAGTEQFRYISQLNMALRAVVTIGSLVLIFVGVSLTTLILFVIPVYILFWIVSRVMARRVMPELVAPPQVAALPYLAREGWPMLLSGLAASSLYTIDLSLLQHFTDAESAGYYSIGARIYLMLVTLPDVFASWLYPVLSRKAHEGPEQQAFTLERCWKLALLPTVPAVAGAVLLAEPLLLLLPGAKFLPALGPFMVFVIIFGLETAQRVFEVFLKATGRQRVPAVFYAFALAIKVLLFIPLLNRGGVDAILWLNLGIGIGTTLAFIGAAKWLLPALCLKRLSRDVLLPIGAATIVMGLVVLWTRSFALYVTIPLGAVTYGATLFLLGGIDSVDRSYLRQLLARKRA